jgi:hypothetical protein
MFEFQRASGFKNCGLLWINFYMSAVINNSERNSCNKLSNFEIEIFYLLVYDTVFSGTRVSTFQRHLLQIFTLVMEKAWSFEISILFYARNATTQAFKYFGIVNGIIINNF